MMKKITYYKVEKFSSIREMIDNSAAAAGDRVALKYLDDSGKDCECTYAQFRDDTEALGASLEKLGLGAAHVACLGANSFRWILTYLTVLKSAGVFVPVDKELPPDGIVNILSHSESVAVICDEKYLPVIRDNADKLPLIKTVICFGYTEDRDGVLAFDKLVEEGRGLSKTAYDALRSDEFELKMLVYTSGTTGIAKGVMLSEHNLVSSVYYGLQVSTVYDVGLSVLPYHHTYEAVSGILVSLHHRSTICINDSLKNVLKNLQKYSPDYIYVVPAFAELFYKKINESIDRNGKRKDFDKALRISAVLRKIGIDERRKFFASIHTQFGGKLRKIVCGGAPIRPEIGKFFDDIGIDLINGYGITECSPLVAANNDTFNDPSTVGIKLPCVDMKIDDPTDEGIGEICVKGDIVMMGYYKDPERTAEALRDGWFYTGDYGRMNDKEQLLITGRKKNLIVLSNGKNIYPEEIENYIGRLDYVSDVIVRADSDKNGEQFSLIAEIYCADGTGGRTDADILADIRRECAELPAYKRPLSVVVRTEPFPKTTTNKIKRSAV